MLSCSSLFPSPPRKITVKDLNHERSTDLFRAAITGSVLFILLVAADNIVFPTNDVPLTEENGSELPDSGNVSEPDVPQELPEPEDIPEPDIPDPDIPEEDPSDEQPEASDEVPDGEIKRTRSDSSVSVLTEFLSVATAEEGYYHNGANTKYTGNFDYNGPDEWSAEFLSWCVEQTEEKFSFQLGGDMFPWSDSVTDCFLWFISHGLFDDSGSFFPWGGDYVFLDTDLDGLIDRVGVVLQTETVSTPDLYGNVSEETTIKVICGNMPSSKKVEIFELLIDDPAVSGFGVIN